MLVFLPGNWKTPSGDSASCETVRSICAWIREPKLTAATIVNEYSEEQLTRLFRELGEEPAARRIASLIVKMRKTAPFRETLPLARAIEKLVGRHGRHHPATQVFQALRMEVNDELGALEEGLRVFTARLERGGAYRGDYFSFT